MGVGTLTIAALIVSAAVILICCLKSKHFLKYILLSILSGLAAFFAVQLLGTVIELTVPITPLTLGISCLGGVPGVILILVLDVLVQL